MEEQLIKYGVFFIPPPEVIQHIISWKEKICLIEPDAPYALHPVHMTIFLCTATQEMEQAIISGLQQCCNNIETLPLVSSGWHIFLNDPLTGGNTLVMDIALTGQLLSCQQKLASAIAEYREMQVNSPVSWEGVYKTSYDQWGFPFVGDHWRPHITVASARGNAKEVIKQAIDQHVPVFHLKLDSLSLFRIAGDTHTLLTTISL